jgi:hypothetical protein
MIIRECFYHPYLKCKQVWNPSGCDEMALDLKSFYLWRRIVADYLESQAALAFILASAPPSQARYSPAYLFPGSPQPLVSNAPSFEGGGFWLVSMVSV